MDKYEYKIINDSNRMMEEQLDFWGDMGWELCGYAHLPEYGKYEYIFKHKKGV